MNARNHGLTAIGLALGCLRASQVDARQPDQNLDRIVAQQAALLEQQGAEIAALRIRLQHLEQGGVADKARSAAPVAADAAKAPQLAASQTAAPASPAGSDALLRQDSSVASPQTRVALSGQAPAWNPGGKAPSKISWTGGSPTITSGDGFFTFHPRVRLVTDYTMSTGSAYAHRNVQNSNVRAARLGADGTIGRDFFYNAQIDFAGNTAQVQNALVGYASKINSKIPFEVRIGQSILERGIEGASSVEAIPFLDRSTVAYTIAPSSGFYGTGIVTKIWGHNWHAVVQFTGDVISNNATDNETESVLTGRFTWNPVNTKDMIVHLGLTGVRERFSDTAPPGTRSLTLDARYTANVAVTTGVLPKLDHAEAYSIETGATYHSAYLFGEAGRREVSFVPGTLGGLHHMDAWTVYGGYFLTGEHPNYSSKIGTFVLSPPNRSLDQGGTGAIEVNGRYETVDLTDLPQGGHGRDWTVGVNWYPNRWTRFEVNGVRWFTDNKAGAFAGSDNGWTFAGRAQLWF